MTIIYSRFKIDNISKFKLMDMEDWVAAIIFIKNIENSVIQYIDEKIKKVLYKYFNNNIIRN